MIDTVSWMLPWPECPVHRPGLGLWNHLPWGSRESPPRTLPKAWSWVLIDVHGHALGDLWEQAQAGVPNPPAPAPVLSLRPPHLSQTLSVPGASSPVPFPPVVSVSGRGPSVLSWPKPEPQGPPHLCCPPRLPHLEPIPRPRQYGGRGREVQQPTAPLHVQPVPQLTPRVDHSRK